jgi:hypothetical protein
MTPPRDKEVAEREARILAMKARGETHVAIAKAEGITRQRVDQIVRGDQYRRERRIAGSRHIKLLMSEYIVMQVNRLGLKPKIKEAIRRMVKDAVDAEAKGKES